MDGGADGDAGDHVGPHLADDVLDRLPGVVHARRPVELLAVLGVAHADLAHPVLDVALHLEATDDPAGDHGDEEPRDEVQRGDLPAEQAVEQHQRDLVDHRRGDQEREGDAERDAGLDEADEQRHGRAAAERRDDAEAGGHHVAGRLAPAVQQGPRALRAEERAHDADAEDDDGEQQQHLDGVVDEELESDEARRPSPRLSTSCVSHVATGSQ